MRQSPVTSKRRSVLEEWMARDEEIASLTRRIQRIQRQLREAASPKTWRLYLKLEEHTNARHRRVVERALMTSGRRGLTER